MNLCVLCPHDEDGELTTVSISRAKSARDLLKTSVIAPVDTVLGTAKGAVVGAKKGWDQSLLTSSEVGFDLGGALGDEVYGIPLGLIALGVVTPVILTHAELKGLLTGLNHGEEVYQVRTCRLRSQHQGAGHRFAAFSFLCGKG